MDIKEKFQLPEDLLPCPFCGSSDLSEGMWCLDDTGEVDAVECADCYAGAPIACWQKRANLPHQLDSEQIATLTLDANRYQWLRARDANQIKLRGLFVGMTPDNLVLTERHLDVAMDIAMKDNREPSK